MASQTGTQSSSPMPTPWLKLSETPGAWISARLVAGAGTGFARLGGGGKAAFDSLAASQGWRPEGGGGEEDPPAPQPSYADKTVVTGAAVFERRINRKQRQVTKAFMPARRPSVLNPRIGGAGGGVCRYAWCTCLRGSIVSSPSRGLTRLRKRAGRPHEPAARRSVTRERRDF